MTDEAEGSWPGRSGERRVLILVPLGAIAARSWGLVDDPDHDLPGRLYGIAAGPDHRRLRQYRAAQAGPLRPPFAAAGAQAGSDPLSGWAFVARRPRQRPDLGDRLADRSGGDALDGAARRRALDPRPAPLRAPQNGEGMTRLLASSPSSSPRLRLARPGAGGLGRRLARDAGDARRRAAAGSHHPRGRRRRAFAPSWKAPIRRRAARSRWRGSPSTDGRMTFSIPAIGATL